MSAEMRLDDPGSKLQTLRDTAERISANLVELELDSSRQLLDASKLQGESAARWSAARDALTELWRRQALLEGLLRRADKLRGSRRGDELRSLLEGPSIELSSSDVPLAERELLGGAKVARRCSPDELLAGMSTSFDDVKTVVSRIGAAWETLLPKLDVARLSLQEIRRLGEELGECGRRDVESATQTLAAVSASVAADPLSVRADEVDGLIDGLAVIRRELEAGAALKRGFEASVRAARELLARVRATIRVCESARRELLVKISAPTFPPAPAAEDDLERELADILARAQQGAWVQARRSLARWTAGAEARLHDATRALEANRAPIEARNQLRALLDAYQVKAKRLGRREDPRLAGVFSRAQETLYSAPTDLALAAELVRTYQQALSGSKPAPEERP